MSTPFDQLDFGFNAVEQNFSRPWGGYACIDPNQLTKFIETYFPGLEVGISANISQELSPKILFVLPGKRLSWQYHHRRSEIWRVLQGPVGIVRSDTDTEGPLVEYQTGEVIEFDAGERHRLVGLNEMGIVAELWQHLDPNHPSDEEDIVRLQDDFGRN
jgi:mannose-6-phosphate isomerase-like protein (cupin superfamily)